MGLLPETQNCGLCMRRQCRERFPRHRGLAIQTCITARAWRTGHDAWRDRYLTFAFEVGGVENFPGIPAACATRSFAYLVRGPWRQYGQFLHINKTNMRVLLVPSLVSHTIGSSWYYKICNKSQFLYIFVLTYNILLWNWIDNIFKYVLTCNGIIPWLKTLCFIPMGRNSQTISSPLCFINLLWRHVKLRGEVSRHASQKQCYFHSAAESLSPFRSCKVPNALWS